MNFLKPLSLCLRSTILTLADVSLIGMLGGLSVHVLELEPQRWINGWKFSIVQ